MIAIEDKLSLFKKIVYEKVEKENQEILSKLNDDFEQLLEEKKEGFKKEAQMVLEEGLRSIQKEKLQMISKAKVDEKKILLEMRKEIFYEVNRELINYTKNYVETDNYKGFLFRELTKALDIVGESDNFKLYLIQSDVDRFEDEIYHALKDRKVELCVDNELLGGFVVFNKVEETKLDMSIACRIHNSKDIIGERLHEILQQEVK